MTAGVVLQLSKVIFPVLSGITRGEQNHRLRITRIRQVCSNGKSFATVSLR